MNEKSDRDLVDLLLERDVPLDGERYSRHRKRLDEQLQEATRNEKIVRIATILIWAGASSYLLVALVLQRMVPRGGLPAGLLGDVVVPAASLMSFACGALAIPMLVLYLVRYRRAVDRARDAVRDVVLIELQQTVERLKSHLEGRDKSP